jgi:transposase
MSEASSRLVIPSELSACQALIEQQAFTISEQQQQLEKAHQEMEELSLQVAELLQRVFGQRRERYIANPDQLMLDFGGGDDAADAAAGLAEAFEEQVIREHTRRRTRVPCHEKIPDHIERYEVDAKVSEDVKNCPQHGERKLIGYDTTNTVEFERPTLRVRVTRYAKYACAGCASCGVSSPKRPTSLVEGDRYDTSVAAEIITGKYGYHLPIYRQQDYFAGSGWSPSRSTLLNVLSASAVLLRPVAGYFQKLIVDSSLLGTDDTRVTLLLPKTIPKAVAGDAKSQRVHEVIRDAKAEGKPSIRARMWAYRSMIVPLTAFDFTVSRHRDGPDLFLKEFSGKLLADCYAGYQSIALGSAGGIERGACVAHARRKVFDARDAYPLESSFLLSQFQQLYDIEDRAKQLSAEERVALRQQEGAPVWQAMRAWLDSDVAEQVLPKSGLGQALTYLRNHWDPLRLYLSEGRMPIDNNEVEQLMKQVAIGRKNWLFIGSVAAGERAADLLTVVSSAVRNDLDVWAYVKDLLDQLLSGATDYGAMRPDVWKQAHPEAIRTYRTAERRDRADRKQRRRARRRQRERG